MRKRLSANDSSNVASIETKLDQGEYSIYILSYIIDVFIMKDER